MAVPLRGAKAAGRAALVDDEDYELVSQLKWYAKEESRPGRRPSGPYAMARITRGGKRTTIQMHTLLTGWPETDHRDHDGLNNQRSNLRPGRGVNQRNARPQLGGTSQYKGVCWYTPLRGQGRWKAQIRATGMSRHLGYFLSEVDAAHAYDTAARAAFGEYAVVNFPIESRYELLTLTHP